VRVSARYWNPVPKTITYGNAAIHARPYHWGRLGDPKGVADAVAYLIESSCVTGVRIPVDGGVRLVG
jgi:NAD(P)-dependent dehydrogenase (short-subunit alcohol dehydrogenase family)